MSSGPNPSVNNLFGHRVFPTGEPGQFIVYDRFGSGYTVNDIDDGQGDDLGRIGDIQNDRFEVSGFADDNVFVGSLPSNQGVLLQRSNNYYYLYSTNSRALNDVFTIQSTPFAVCYCTGTRILTARGEVAVEDLEIGDTVVTASGQHRPIKWIGTRSYAPRLANANAHLLPVRFQAGSLGDGVPARDLRVSPKHAMFLDGVLIPAEHLVNGLTILKETRVEELSYFHVELDSHDVLIAEGAASESFVDDSGRGIFQNASTFHALYPDERPVEAVYCAPRVEDGHVLQAVRRRLSERAGLDVTPARDLGALRGKVDGCDGTRVWGWAQSAAFPDAPVCLEVVVDGTAVALIYADRPRADLAAAGIGDGCHAFNLTLPSPLGIAQTITVRRGADGATLGGVGRVERVMQAA